MSNQRNTTAFVLLAALIVVTATVLIMSIPQDIRSLAFTTQEKTNKSEDEKKMPIVVYSSSLPAGSSEPAIRLTRNGRYDKRYPEAFDELSPTSKGRVVINDWYTYISALPVAESDAIVLGKVVSASAYLSNDRTGAYSEFTIHVTEVLKDHEHLSDRPVVAAREGADVQLPSGRIIRYEIIYQGMPQLDRQYVLFLKYDNQGKIYTILTGYELRKNHVSPLDEVDPFISYKRTYKDTFLREVREAIAQPSEKRKLDK